MTQNAKVQANNALVAKEQAALAEKRADEKRAASRARVASGKNQSAPGKQNPVDAPNVQTALNNASVNDTTMAAILARLEALEAKNQTLETENAALKAGKTKTEKPSLENETITVKGDILTITVDLSKDTGRDIASKARKIVASSGTFGFHNVMHKGVRFSLDCKVYHDNPDFDALDKAYKAAKKSAK